MKKKFLIAIFALICMIFFVCNNTVPKEEYNKVVAEKEDYKEEIETYNKENEILNKVKESLSVTDGLTFSESKGDGCKTLIITSYVKIQNSTDSVQGEFGKLGKALDFVVNEEWFDYDYVIVEVWGDSLGAMVSMTFDTDDILAAKTYNWYEEIGNPNSGEAITQQGKVVYQDDNVIITFTGITGREDRYDVNFMIENLSARTLTVQVRETSINGMMVDPMCSIDVAPEKKTMDKMTIWSDDAKNHPMSTVENIETKFHIFNPDDWQDRYDTESIKIVGN